MSRLIDAAENGDIYQLRAELAAITDIDAVNVDGMTALHSAVLNGHAECVKLLLDQSADVNIQNADGYTPLHLAVWDHHVECIKLLLAHGADVNIENNKKVTPVHDAMRDIIYYKYDRTVHYLNRYLEVLELMFSQPIDHNGICEVLVELYPACHIEIWPQIRDRAILPKRRDLLEMLLVKDLGLDWRDQMGNTLLHVLCSCSNAPAEDISKLLHNGANVNASNHVSNTPMLVFLKQKRPTKVGLTLLLEREADVNAVNDAGETPLQVIADRPSLNDLAEMLLDYGASPLDNHAL